MANLITIGPDVESQPLNDNFAALNDDIVNIPHGLYRNAIINGNFDVWQRGTSFSNPMSGTYTADRWINLYDGTGQQHTISQQAFMPGQTEVPNEPKNFLRVAVTNAATGQTFNVLQQRIESVRTFAGLKVTLSFWAKADAARTLAANFLQNFGSGGSSVVGISGPIFNLTTNWQKFSCTVTIPSISGKVIGPGDNLGVEFFFPVGETFVIDIAQVQLNAGDVALPFQPRSFAEELALCQRYFEKTYSYDVTPGTVTNNGIMTQYTESNYLILDNGAFKVPKRVAPTVKIYSPSGAANKIQKFSDVQDYPITGVEFASTNRAGRIVIASGTGVPGMYCWHRTADAEL